MIKKLKDAKVKVEELLAKYPTTRDCDKTLYLAYLLTSHDVKRKINDGGYDAFKEIFMNKDTTTMDSITRARRKIQEEGRWIGIKRKYRKMEEEIVREHIREL